MPSAPCSPLPARLPQLAEQLIADMQHELGRRADGFDPRANRLARTIRNLPGPPRDRRRPNRNRPPPDDRDGGASSPRPKRIALAEQRRGQGHGIRLAQPLSFEQHAGQPRTDRQPGHRFPQQGDVSRGIDRPEPLEQALGLFQRGGRRGLEPGKGTQISLAPDAEFQQRPGQVEAANLRLVARGPLAMGPLGPQPQTNARLRAAGAARPLIGRGPRDLHHLQAVHAHVWIEAQRAGQAAIDHGRDAFDRQRGFRDVR